jgi:hypothetical protein
MNILAPINFSHFLNVFDLVNETGDSYFDLITHETGDIYEINEIHDTVSRYFEASGYGLFSFSQNVAALRHKINYEVDEQNKILIYNLAAFLALPCDNPKEELDELKEFFIYIKEENIKINPKDCGIIYLSRVNQDNVSFGVSIKNQIEENKLNLKLEQKILASPVLMQWFENQREGIIHTHSHLNDLTAHFSIFSLFSETEKKVYLNNTQNERKITQKAQRKQLTKR